MFSLMAFSNTNVVSFFFGKKKRKNPSSQFCFEFNLFDYRKRNLRNLTIYV